MANTIRIKRRAAGGAAGAPTTLAAAELAYNEQDNIMYYGKGDVGGVASTVVVVAGSGAFTPIAHVGTGGTAHADVVAAGASGFMTGADKAKLNAITGTNTGDQTTITGNAGSATVLQTARTINGVSFNGSANITINAVDSTARVASSLLGAANGVATLDASGTIPSIQLPSFVDDVVEYANLASFPATGAAGKIYVALDTNKTYRWSGTVYIYITSGAVDSVGGNTGVVTNAQISAAATAGYGFTPYSNANPNGYTTNVGTVTGVTATAPVSSSGGTAPVISMVAATAVVNGYMTSTYAAKLDGIAASANNYAHPNHSGDVTSTADGATVIGANKVANTMLSQVATATIKGRVTAATGNVEDLTAANVRSIINVADGANNYAHPTGDGNLHVPATSTTNSGKVLTAGATAGSLSWVAPLALSSTAPAALASTAVVGVGTTAARSDHAHALDIAAAGTLGGVKIGSGLTIDGTGILAVAGGSGVPFLISTNTAATAGSSYVMTAALTLTLPAAPTTGSTIEFYNAANATCYIARNTQSIMGLAEDLTVEAGYSSAKLVFTGGVQGWFVTDATSTQIASNAWTAITGKPTTVAGYGITDAVGVTNLAQGTRTTTTVPITSSTGTTATLDVASTTLAGVMSSADKTKLDAITGTHTGSNTGDNAINTLYSGLVTNATHTGDVTGATALTIAAGAVTLAKMANMATGSLIYRKTAATGAPEVQTLATLKTDLGLTGTNSGDQTTITGNAGSATNIAGGLVGQIPYQSGAGATAMLAVSTAGQFLRGNASAAPSWQTLSLTDLPDAWVKKSVRVASLANVVIATGGLQTVDGIVTAAGDRVLLKNQTAQVENGIYQVNAGAWTRTTDADSISEVAGMLVNVDSGTQGGVLFDCDLKSTDTLGTTAITFSRVVDSSYTIPATQGGTGQTSYAIGDLLYASSTTALSRLADVAVGSVLVSGGVGVAPSWSTAYLSNASTIDGGTF